MKKEIGFLRNLKLGHHHTKKEVVQPDNRAGGDPKLGHHPVTTRSPPGHHPVPEAYLGL
jgi:hypothetical protein